MILTTLTTDWIQTIATALGILAAIVAIWKLFKENTERQNVINSLALNAGNLDHIKPVTITIEYVLIYQGISLSGRWSIKSGTKWSKTSAFPIYNQYAYDLEKFKGMGIMYYIINRIVASPTVDEDLLV